jgi:hypothetical protein
MHCHHLA